MAELVLVTADDANPNGYRKGDILEAFNDRQILCNHTQKICNHTTVKLNRDGLRPANSLALHFQQAIRQYRFDPVGTTELKRTTLATGKEEVFAESSVREYIRQRIRHAKHRIFGTTGNEFWFGGRTRATTAALNTIWVEIENSTPLLKSDHLKVPWDITQRLLFLPIVITDITDERQASLVAEDTDDKQKNLHQKRLHRIDWENDLTMTGAEIDAAKSRTELVTVRHDKVHDEQTKTQVKLRPRPR